MADVMIWSSSVKKAEMRELAVVVGLTWAEGVDERKGTTAESLEEREEMYWMRCAEVLVPSNRLGNVVGGACPA